LWEEWLRGDRRALARLLAYNEDDVVNLYLLEKELARLDDGSAVSAPPRRGGIR
jgi:uncharacterized protein YprB with RNaseH-like and TPR domain